MWTAASDYPSRSHRLSRFSFHACFRLQKRAHFLSVDATSGSLTQRRL